MKHCLPLLLAAIIYLPIASLPLEKASFVVMDQNQVQACMEACNAFIDQPGWELRACIAKCQKKPKAL